MCLLSGGGNLLRTDATRLVASATTGMSVGPHRATGMPTFSARANIQSIVPSVGHDRSSGARHRNLLCHFFSYGVFNSQLAVFLNDTFTWNGHPFGPTELGYLLTADGAINIVVQLFLLRWLGRAFTERNLVVLIFGESLYGAWIAVVITVAVLGGVLARGRLRPLPA